jgi:hypothetical protein
MRRHRQPTLIGQAATNILDVVVYTEGLLDDDDATLRRTCRLMYRQWSLVAHRPDTTAVPYSKSAVSSWVHACAMAPPTSGARMGFADVVVVLLGGLAIREA